MRADFDFDDDRDRRPWGRLLRVLRIVAEVVLVGGALTILYLAFRGPSSHPPASSSPAAGTLGSGVPTTVAPPATVRPTVAPSAAAPSATAGAGTGQAAPDSFSARAQSYLAGRRGRVEAAVYDLSTGRQWTVGQQAPQAEGSVVDLEILEAALNQRMTQRTVMSLTEQELSPPMIEQSDDDAASTLWGDVGGARGMRAFDHKAGLARTSPSTCLRCHGFSGPGWQLTTSTPQDQVTLLRRLAQPSGVLDANDRKYALYLLKNVTSSQRWGITGGTVALQSGSLKLDGGWQVNSVGWVSGDGRNYLMAVFAAGNPGEQYGIDTLSHLGALAWSALAPHR